MSLPTTPPKALTVAELAAAGVDKSFHFADAMVAVSFGLPKGTILKTHAHPYGHLSVLAKGKVRVTVDGVALDVIAPNCLNIRQGMSHEIVALQDSHWYCIHAHNEGEPDDTTIEDILLKPKAK